MSQANPTKREADTYAQAFHTGNGVKSDAFRATFPNTKAKLESINVSASRLHDTPMVQLRIKQLAEIAEDEANAVFGITARYLIEVNQRVIEAGLRLHPDKDGNSKAENLGAVVSAGGAISKICGHDAPTKSEVEANVKVQKISVEFIGND